MACVRTEKSKIRPKELKGLKPTIISKVSDYRYTNIQLFVNNRNLYIRMTGYREKIKWLVIENFERYTALEIIREVDLGRHFEDGLLKLYHLKNLNLGHMRKFLK